MERLISILLLSALLLTSCNKNKEPDLSGTATIDNELVLDEKLQTYINYGFLFSEARLASNAGTPKPDIVFRDGDNISFEANNLKLHSGNTENMPMSRQPKTAFNNFTLPVRASGRESANL